MAGAGLRACALVLVLAALLLAVTAAGASALVVQLPNGKTVSIQPRRGHLPSGLSATGLNSTANLIYHGGPVMSSNSNYAFYWAPSGSPAYPAEYQPGVNQFLEDLAHDSGGEQNVDSVAVQYTDGSGHAANYDSHFAGAIIDTDPYPANGCKKAPICLTDAQLQAELGKYIVAHELPRDLAHEYFMLTPPKVEDCFEANGLECSAGTTAGVYCAYHSSFTSGTGVIVYANDPYVTGIEGCDTGEHPNNKPSDGVIQGGLSHEHNESITDPELDAWYGSNGEENGDKCRTFVESSEYGTPLGTAPDGSRFNQLINGHEYWYQQEWSNQGSVCKQRLALSLPVVSKLGPLKGPAGGGTQVKITGTGFTGATSVHFGSQEASFTVGSSTKIVATAPAGAVGTVDVTVTNTAGTSAITTADRYKYTPTVTSLSPSSGSTAGGTSVTVTGTGFALGSGTIFKFGGTKAATVNCTSATKCTVIAPRHAAATVDVKATVNAIASPKSAGDRYTYS
jgi:IPT/TIG domain